MRPDTLLVIGLGPAGGSVAWGAMQGGVPRVVGYDRVRGDAIQALRAGAVHAIADRLEDAVAEAQLVVVAGGGPETLARVAPRLAPEAFVTTIGQVGAPAARVAVGAGVADRWAASHPRHLPAGRAFEDARPEAFAEAMVAVASLPGIGERAGSEVRHFWESVFGAEAVQMTVEDHDRRLAWMEHLPALLAAAYAAALADGPLRAATIGGAAARLHALAPDAEAMAAIAANREAVGGALAAVQAALRTLEARSGGGEGA